MNKPTDIYKSKDVCEMLNISARTLKNWREKGYFGPEPLGMSSATAKFYSASEIKAWLRAGCPQQKDWIRKRGVLRF